MLSGRSIPLVRVFGIRVGVDPSWFLALFLFIWLLTGYYQDAIPGKNDTGAFLLATASALLFFTSILLHELGHAWVAIRNRIPIAGIDLWLFGGIARMSRDTPSPGVEFRVAPDLYELSFDRVDVGDLSGIPLIGLKELSLRGWNLVVKRAMDLALTLLAAPVVLPLAALIVVAIRRDSPGPAIFEQRRLGKDVRPFTAYKFRTMVVDAEARKAALAPLNEADGPLFKIRNDPRMTHVGRILRRTSLDELPQLWNVLRGEMSLVGPRPPTLEEAACYQEWQARRLEVLPGLTGLWQVLGRSDTSFNEMVRLDIYYAENWSLGMDLRILLRTIPAVISGRGAY